jgi:MoaA/NifB/PqqE/SkfB family radical SAM enzyme
MIDKVFCSVPWREIHINADGTFHTCGAQRNIISGTPMAATYNIHNMSLDDWVNSQHQINARANKLAGIPEPLCKMCYHEEDTGGTSTRLRELQSHGKPIEFFKNSQPNITNFHVSLGNECNLSCRMCNPIASSKVAVAEIKAGTYSGPARLNWTEDQLAWNNFIDFLCNSKGRLHLHLIGGEPLLNPRFEELVDVLIAKDKTNIYLGFTTNGTTFNKSLMDKLSIFSHVDIGISIECMGELNEFVRQGSSTETVLKNIELYLKYRKQGHVYVTIRTVPSALTIHTLYELYEWCVEREADVLSNFLIGPPYQQIKQLPFDVKQRLISRFKQWSHSDPAPEGKNPRDPTWFKQHIDTEIKSLISALELPNDPSLTKTLYENLELWQWTDNEKIAKYFKTDTIK